MGGPTPHLEKRRKLGRPKDSSDSSAAGAPSTSVSRDDFKPAEKPNVLPSVDIGKDSPISVPKPGILPSADIGKDAPASAPQPDVRPSKDIGKDLPTSTPKPSMLPSEDIGKDPTISEPKPGFAPNTITTTVTSIVTAPNGESPSTTTFHVTDTKTVTVSAGTNSKAGIVSNIPLSGAALTNALLAEKGRSSNSMVSSQSQAKAGNNEMSVSPSATDEMDRAAAGVSAATGRVTNTSRVASPVCSPIPVTKKQMSPATIVAMVFGLIILILVGSIVFLVRRFYMMYRAERLLRTQAQAEINELKETSGQTVVGGTTVVERPSKGKWGFKRKESWEK